MEKLNPSEHKGDKLPQTILFDGKEYTLSVEHFSNGMLSGWWCMKYIGDDGMPPSVNDGINGYYLASVAPKEEDAQADLHEKLSNANGITKIYR